MKKHYMPDMLLWTIAKNPDKWSDEQWSRIVEHEVFSQDLRQLPMPDQDRVFQAVTR